MIEYKHLVVRYNNQYVFSDFSLSIQEQEKVLFSGRSGSGKTTLLKLLLGFEFLHQEAEDWHRMLQTYQHKSEPPMQWIAYSQGGLDVVRDLLTAIEA